MTEKIEELRAAWRLYKANSIGFSGSPFERYAASVEAALAAVGEEMERLREALGPFASAWCAWSNSSAPVSARWFAENDKIHSRDFRNAQRALYPESGALTPPQPQQPASEGKEPEWLVFDQINTDREPGND